MKLNSSKCAFGVSLEKFLGFMVSHRGIEANPDKIQAILDMKPRRRVKEVQYLTRRVAALNRFGVLKVLISDNGRHFDNTLFRDFCEHFGIQNHYSSPAHPQANGQVEVANRSLSKTIKTCLEGAKGVWPDELPGVL
nr:uncharacterized protein LOC112017924 [Quercus suber]